MPTTKQLAGDAFEFVIGRLDEERIKSSFSNLVQALHDKIYEEYLIAEEDAWDRLMAEAFPGRQPSFEQLNKFFLSLGQSRKSRAGKAFEIILEELLGRHLGYPMDGQVDVDGARPDFVMPSGEYFDQNPIDCMLLTAKRTLRERWRQVVTEANKTYSYFLATLDPKVSSNQLKQASTHKIYLVTTESNIQELEHYQAAGNVMSFETFISAHLDPAMMRWPSKS